MSSLRKKIKKEKKAKRSSTGCWARVRAGSSAVASSPASLSSFVLPCLVEECSAWMGASDWCYCYTQVCHHLFSATSTHDPLRSLNLNHDAADENLCADSASGSDTARHDIGRRIDCLPAAVARWAFVDWIDSWTPSSRLTTTRFTVHAGHEAS